MPLNKTTSTTLANHAYEARVHSDGETYPQCLPIRSTRFIESHTAGVNAVRSGVRVRADDVGSRFTLRALCILSVAVGLWFGTACGDGSNASPDVGDTEDAWSDVDVWAPVEDTTDATVDVPPDMELDVPDGEPDTAELDLEGWGIDAAAAPANVERGPTIRRLTAVPRGDDIAVTWEPFPDAERYVVYRSTLGPGGSSGLVSAQVDSNHMIDTNVATDGEEHYAYAVAPVVDGEELPPSYPVTARSISATPPMDVRVTMTAQDLSELYARDRDDDTLLPAEVRIEPDGLDLDVRGLRFRGSGSRGYPKLGFNIRLEEDPEFNFGSERRDGSDRLLLLAMWTDPTGLRDTLAFEAYRDLGQPAPRTNFAHLYINGVFEGLYNTVERIDRDALREWSLNRRRAGMTLVRDEIKNERGRLGASNRSTFGYDLGGLHETREDQIAFLASVFDWRGEEEDQDWDALADLILWVNDTPAGDDFADGFMERFNVDNVMDFLALHAIFLDADALDSDYWLYRDNDGDNLWMMIPWDKNLTFGADWIGAFRGANDFLQYDLPILIPHTNRLVNRVLDTPALFEQFADRVAELVETSFHRDWVKSRIEAHLPTIIEGIQIQPGDESYSVHPAQHHGDVAYLPHHLEALGEFMDLRARWLHADIARRRGLEEGEAMRAAHEDVTLASGEQLCFVDRDGITMGCITPDSPWQGSATLAIVSDEAIEGVQRRYILQSTDAFEGTLRLYYQNAPRNNWLTEDEWAGPQWTLDLLHTTSRGDGTARPARVNPFANLVEGDVNLDPGVHTFALEFGE